MLLWAIISVCDYAKYSLGFSDQFQGFGVFDGIKLSRQPPVTDGTSKQDPNQGTPSSCSQSKGQPIPKATAPTKKPALEEEDCRSWY